VVELSPIDHETTVSFLGDGMKYPPPGVRGAGSRDNRERVFRKWIVEPDGSAELVRLHSVHPLGPQQRLREYTAGGGGAGDPFDRPADLVFADWCADLVSLESCRTDYGVVIDAADHRVDDIQTAEHREATGGTAP